MFVNIFLIVFFSFISWLLYRYPMKAAKTSSEYRRLFYFFIVIAFFVFINGVFAYMGVSGLKLTAESSPIPGLMGLEGKKSGDGVIITGKTSENNEYKNGDYIAYIDDIGLWSPMNLWIDFKNGETIAITNNTYQATGWPVDGLNYLYIKENQELVIVGYVENNIDIFNGEKTQTIRADIVFAGSHEEFIARAESKILISEIIMSINAVLIFLLIIYPLRITRKKAKN